MSTKRLVFVGFMFLAVSGLPVFGAELSIPELLSQPDRFDGEELVVQGEVIGNPMKSDSGQGVWFNIVAGAHLSVFSERQEVSNLIRRWGNFRQRGDIVSVTGRFHTQCPQHQMSDIHLSKLVVVQKGFYFDNTVSTYKQNAAIALLLLCLVMALIYFIKTRKTPPAPAE